MRDVRALLFDLDDTLLASSEGDAEAMRLTLSRHLHHFPGASFEGLVEAHARVLARVQADYTEGKPWRFPPERFAELLASLGGDPGVAPGMGEFYYGARLRLIKPYPGTREFLASAAARYRLGLVTNGPVHSQRRVLDAVGFASLFDPVLVAGEVGVRKPDPRIFRMALDRWGIAPSEVLVVGDSYALDVAPARALGMRAALVTGAPGDMRSRLLDPDGPHDGPCDLRVARVADLAHVLFG